ncbi:MAG: NADP-dependent oxidoreductase [Hahellaceae bacterium]|nr:NADP-dependent oxidoreductase [Hahellaceae bacterium]
MKAIYQTAYGKSDVLCFGDRPEPRPGPKEVLIQNYATSVNPRDWLIRSGRYQLQFLVPAFPLVLGSDLAGRVIAVGAGVSEFQVGDRVFGMKNPCDGLATYADVVSVSAKHITHTPEGLDWIQAGATPLCALTAWQALVKGAGIKPGMSVMVIGASGGVGSFAVQIARALGARVTAVCSGANAELARRLGATRVIDYQREDVLKQPERFDCVFDTIGRHRFTPSCAILNQGGRFVSTIPSPQNLKVMAISKMRALLQPGHPRAHVVMVRPDAKDLAEIAGLIAAGQLTPLIDRVYPLHEAAQAHDYSRTLRARGKIVLSIQP